jgi:four helix bundle protein
MKNKKTATSFTDLIVWQKAHQFVLETYHYSSSFPVDERYGLTSQFRRAAVSIASNIAEGFKRKGLIDKARFFNIAQASLEECRYYLILASDLGFGVNKDLMELSNEVSRLLRSYSTAILRSKS